MTHEEFMALAPGTKFVVTEGNEKFRGTWIKLDPGLDAQYEAFVVNVDSGKIVHFSWLNIRNNEM